MNLTEYILFLSFRSGSPQVRMDYNSDNFVIYLGIGQKGAATSDASWLISKFTYDSNNNVTLIQTSPDYSIWDNRTTLTYS